MAAAGRAAGRLRRGARAALARRAGRRPPRARRARPAGVRQAGAARLLGRHRQGRRPRPSSAPALDERVRARPAGDRRGVRRGHRGRVLGDRPRRRPRPRCPGEIVLLGGRDWYDYEAKYARGGMELRRAGATCRRPCASDVRALAVEAFQRVGCSGLARVDFFVEDDAGARQRAQHDARLHRHERVPEAVGGQRRRRPRARATGCSASRSSATAPSAPATRSSGVSAPSSVISEISTRSSRPAAAW